MLGIVGVAGYFGATKWQDAPQPTSHWTTGMDAHTGVPAGTRTEALKEKYRRAAAEREQVCYALLVAHHGADGTMSHRSRRLCLPDRLFALYHCKVVILSGLYNRKY